MNIKKELKTFFSWLRNGTCFAITWFLILRIIASAALGIEAVSINSLINMVLWTSGGVLLFCLVFTSLVIKKTGFTGRLTIFMILFTVYEIGYFYYEGIFTGLSSVYEWLLFALLVISMYLICLAIYSIYRRKKGDLYTLALQKYQQERKSANEA